jgi:RHS repeat-associated protein
MNAQDYYPFGMEMPGRTYVAAGAGNYRFGFNGKENDNEVNGVGNWQDYGLRMYDPRVGRFSSIDPLTKKYPELAPYQFASNRPIEGIDLDGAELFKKDNNNYMRSYDPVFSAPDAWTGANNAAGNVLNFLSNLTYGPFCEFSKSVNNYFAGGYKEPTTDPISSTIDFTNEQYEYFHGTPFSQILKDYGNAATDLKNYELAGQYLLFRRFSLRELPIKPTFGPLPLPTAGEMFTSSISTRGALEKYAIGTKYNSFWNMNEFIMNNKTFDLISNAFKTIVDVTSTDAKTLKASSLYKKLRALSKTTQVGADYKRILQVYIKENAYKAEEISAYKEKIREFIKSEQLNVDFNVEEVRKH